jgi:dipeptidyl aminopeptidase/acylaminoacyl peptidase
MKTVAPYGTWASPIDVETLARAGSVWRRFEQPEPTAGGVWWLESRAEEDRTVAVFKPRGGDPLDATPAGFSVRTKVHEYGGGAAWLGANGALVFSNAADGRLYRQDAPAREPVALTPEGPFRYADGCVTPDGATIVCVRESHLGGEPVNELVALPADGAAPPRTLASGADFYAFPRVSADGRALAWIAWSHPLLPFEGTELCMAELAPDGTPGRVRRVAGGQDEAIFQPAWSPDGVLHFVSDRTSWWNLYREQNGAVAAIAPTDGEIGWPLWRLGLSTYAFLADGRIACLLNRRGEQRLVLVDPDAGRIEDARLRYSAYAPHLRGGGDRLAFVAATPTEAPAVVELHLPTGQVDVVRRSLTDDLPAGWISAPELVEVPTGDGEVAYARFYPPANPDFEAPAGELPPVLVRAHGGPTSQSSGGLDPEVQLLTSRGFAFVDVDYRGSTGYGRAYRDRLRGGWGVLDPGDCVAALRHLAAAGRVDQSRAIVLGGSAGGYATLCALGFHDAFAGGISLYGIANLETWDRETHKFESRYTERLAGPRSEADWANRSPLHAADRFSAPTLLLHGLDDLIVRPAESERMATALRAAGQAVTYLEFAGEGHGFRRADTLRRVHEATLEFIARALGLPPT